MSGYQENSNLTDGQTSLSLGPSRLRGSYKWRPYYNLQSTIFHSLNGIKNSLPFQLSHRPQNIQIIWKNGEKGKKIKHAV